MRRIEEPFAFGPPEGEREESAAERHRRLFTTNSPTPARPVVPTPPPAVERGPAFLHPLTGRGLDVGTANLVSARREKDGSFFLLKERNAFLDVSSDDMTRRLLENLEISAIANRGRLLVAGDPAFDLANVFEREMRRPMRGGVISPVEIDALPVMRLLLERVLGPPIAQGEVVSYSIPAEPVDSAWNGIYHQGVVESLLRRLGYEPFPIHEGQAVVLAELASSGFSGVGISCGAGTFNVTVAHRGIEALSFSISRGGDWIDANVGRALGIPASRATAIKERGACLSRPTSREENTIAVHYRSLIEYTLSTIASRLSASRTAPRFQEPVDVVFSGGTAMPTDFIEVVREALMRMNFPLAIREVRVAKEPLLSVAKGCLVAASMSGTGPAVA